MKKLNILLITFMMIVFSAVPVMAYGGEMPIFYEGSRSITIHLNSPDGNPLEGCELYLYKIASVKVDDEKFYFDYPEEFAECPKLTEDLLGTDSLVTNGEMAEAYLGVIDECKIETLAILKTDAEGVVEFELDSDGLYLIVQRKTNKDHYRIKPFVVTVPYQDGEEPIFEVDATPKTAIVKETPPAPPELPNTGQLNWPIPVMSVAGMICIALGLIVRKHEKTS